MSLLLNSGNAAQVVADSVMLAQQESGMAEEIRLPIMELVMQGGWVMAVLAVLSVYAIYIFITKLSALSRATKEDKNLMNHIRDMIYEGKVEAAVALCKTKNSPISRMIEKGIQRIGKPLVDIQATIENVGNLEVANLEKGVSGMATISGIAPMIGFLGTVIGMIRAFYDMSMAGNNVDIQVLSSGIYQAMVTTVAGLVVGITAYVLHNILVARIDRLVFKLEAKSTEFMDLLNEPVK